MERGLQTWEGNWKEHPFLHLSSGVMRTTGFSWLCFPSQGEKSHRPGSRGGKLPTQAHLPGEGCSHLKRPMKLKFILLDNLAARGSPCTPLFPGCLCTS